MSKRVGRKWVKFIDNWYFIKFGNEGEYSSHILGSKKEPYYLTEAEIFYETEYTYESLSKDEKKIYNNKYE